LCWLASVLPNGVRIDGQVGNPAVAHFYGECFPQVGGRAEVGTHCRKEPDHHQASDASDDQAEHHFSTLFQIPDPVAQAWEAYRPHPLLQRPYPKVGAMSCALRGKAKSSSDLAILEPAALDLKASTLLTTSASGASRLATVTPLVLIPPSRSTFGQTLVTLILGRSATTTYGSLSYVAGSPCGAGSSRCSKPLKELRSVSHMTDCGWVRRVRKGKNPGSGVPLLSLATLLRGGA
jgi:hypothetical protein